MAGQPEHLSVRESVHRCLASKRVRSRSHGGSLGNMSNAAVQRGMGRVAVRSSPANAKEKEDKDASKKQLAMPATLAGQ